MTDESEQSYNEYPSPATGETALFRIRPEIRRRWLVAASLAACLACDDPSYDDGQCPEVPINPNLHRVLYWGGDDNEPGHTVSNDGYPYNDVMLPRWIEDSSILISASVLYHQELQRGIFRLDLDSNQALTKITRYVYDGIIVIREYDWLPDSGELIVYYSTSASHLAIAKAQLTAGQLVLGPELVTTDWIPGGAVHWPNHDGFVFYGTNPTSGTSGFYWLRDDGSADSLLVSFTTSIYDARSFDFSYDGRLLYTATTTGDYPFVCDLYEFDLTTGIGTVIFEGRGHYVALDAHPSEARVLLNRFYDGGAYTRPGSYVDIIDRATGSVSRVDVRTHDNECTFVVAEETVWRPSSRAFAFLAGAFSGEGDNWPLELWIRRLNK